MSRYNIAHGCQITQIWQRALLRRKFHLQIIDVDIITILFVNNFCIVCNNKFIIVNIGSYNFRRHKHSVALSLPSKVYYMYIYTIHMFVMKALFSCIIYISENLSKLKNITVFNRDHFPEDIGIWKFW